VTDAADTLASQFFAAIERGDLNAIRELYSPEVAVWHNVTGRSQTREENLAPALFYRASLQPSVRGARTGILPGADSFNATFSTDSSHPAILSQHPSASLSMSPTARSSVSSSTSTLPLSAVSSLRASVPIDCGKLEMTAPTSATVDRAGNGFE